MPLRLTNRELERLVPVVMLEYAKNQDDKHWQELRGKILNMAGFRAMKDKRLAAMMTTLGLEDVDKNDEFWENPDTNPRDASSTIREKMKADPMLKELIRDE